MILCKLRLQSIRESSLIFWQLILWSKMLCLGKRENKINGGPDLVTEITIFHNLLEVNCLLNPLASTCM